MDPKVKLVAPAVAAGLVALVSLGTVALVAGHGGGGVSKGEARAPVATGPVDFGHGLTFTPSSSGPPPSALSAAAAYSKASGNKPIPATENYQFGFLNQRLAVTPDDPTGASRYEDSPVWAFTTIAACDTGYGPTPIATPTSGQCTTWAFLDAATGRELLEFQP